MSDELAELKRIDAAMRELDPTVNAWWKLRSERNALRDVIDGHRARRDRSWLEVWPKPPTARWRILRAHIEDWHGVRAGDIGRSCERLAKLEKEEGTCGGSLREWVVLVDDILQDNGWEHMFRDAISFKPVPGVERFSILIQGEGDYHWTIANADRRKADPPVKGYWHDEARDRWRPDSAKRDRPYGSFPHVTDFVRSMLETYADALLPHPRLQSRARDQR